MAFPACALPLRGAVAGELWRVELALSDLRTREAQLAARRNELVAALRATRTRTNQAEGSSGAVPPPAPSPGRPRDLSVKAVQNLLLALGGILLVVSAIVFTAVSWGHLGFGGRAAILLGLTGLVLAAPIPLQRRGLATTAETLAMLGLALLFLDGYAAWQVGLAGLDAIRPQPYTAGLTGVVAVALATYGRLARLRLPIPVAVGLAQFPLAVLAFDEGTFWIVAALLATACADATAWLVGWRRMFAVCFGCTWSLGVAIGLAESLETYEPRSAWPLSGALIVAVAAGLVIAVRATRPWSVALAAVSAITLITALTVPTRMVLESPWAVAPAPLAGLSVTVLAVLASRTASAVKAAPLRAAVVEAAVTATVTAAIATALLSTPVATPVLVALTGPLDQGEVWSGIGTMGVREALGAPSVAGPPDLVVLAALALVYAVLTLFLVRRGRTDDAVSRARPHMLIVVALAFASVTVVVCPVALDLPYPAAIAVQLVLAVGLAAISARTALASVLALAAALEVCAWALVSEPATLIVLGVLAVTAAVTVPVARTTAVRTGAAATATLLIGGEAVALWVAADLQPRFVTFVLLGVAGVAVIVAALLKARPRVTVEIAGYALGSAGLFLAVDLPMFSLACAVAGVLAIGTALRPDRRVAGYVGTAFLLLAGWTRLLAERVELVEAYTVPFSLVLLAIGWRRARESSSWPAYGACLSFSLFPSLLAVYAQPGGWLRPLTLGVASFVVLLLGARSRLQAPVALGGFTLAAVAVHELAPWIAQLVTTVPRWVPVAAGGTALVLIGATYEARLKDVRRMRDGFRGLR
ncbi:SCO7613 C-terminal domain-containing membrane protein [Microbispora sp. CA-102843]|uniref:SCO7613 C-terminal domain-containing membrane protein n=1 Tax=Microbispora sp. CA-102843 TaxID=3239952 RepID=UPI003D8B856A